MPYRNRAVWRDDLLLTAPDPTSDTSDALGSPDARARAVLVVAGICGDAGECGRVLEILGLTVADVRHARSRSTWAQPA
jgi:hypothetical protein